MNTEHEIDRIRKTLGTFIAWSATELGSHNVTQLLNMLSAPEEETYNRVPEDPNCLEGPGRTPEEVAQNARELDAVAPTPADKFALMFSANHVETLKAALAKARERIKFDDPKILAMQEIDDALEAVGSNKNQSGENPEIAKLRKERDVARSLVSAFEKEVNAGFNRTAESEKQHADAAISDVNYIFRLHKELRERVEKVIGHWRDTDWFREGSGLCHPDITVGVDEAEAIKLLKYLKP